MTAKTRNHPNFFYRVEVEPGSTVRLSSYDPAYTAGLHRNAGAEAESAIADELGELQELLFAAARHSVLLILQGLDTSGKDGATKAVVRAVNPTGCRIVSFKAPTETELAHDFLWRVHDKTPERGQLGIFNRSHYEDVVAVRVRQLAPEAAWQQRYEHINAFERLLTDNDTIVVKCFLHISKEEQEERLLAREQDVAKTWKLAAGDWLDRQRWDDFIAAYEDALQRCNTTYAPWHIIPSDKKWFRNLAITQLLVAQLRPYQQGWLDYLAAEGQRRLTEVRAVRAGLTTSAGTRA